MAPLELPKKFTEIPLAHLWEISKLANELKGLANTHEEQMYWDGVYDGVSILLGDLTGMRTIKRFEVLAAKFESFRMEDKLRTSLDGEM